MPLVCWEHGKPSPEYYVQTNSGHFNNSVQRDAMVCLCLPIVSKIEVGDGGVAERAHGELGYVVARHVEVAQHGARHSRQSGEAVPAEVQHLRSNGKLIAN